MLHLQSHYGYYLVSAFAVFVLQLQLLNPSIHLIWVAVEKNSATVEAVAAIFSLDETGGV